VLFKEEFVKILFLSTWFPYPPDNGSKIRVYHLLKSLAERHEVTLLSFAFDSADPAAAPRGSRLGVEIVALDPFARQKQRGRSRFLSRSPIVTAPMPEMAEKTRQLLSETRYGVVIASTEVMATYALQAHGAPKILEEHNSFTRMMWDRYRAQSSILQKARCWASWQKTRYYEARLFPRFDRCVMVSEQDRETCLRDLPGYHGIVEVVPNGVDCHHNRPGLAPVAPNTLIYNGALTYSANLDAMRYFLADIYPLIRAQIADVSLTITGATAGVDLSGLALDGSVRLAGYVPDVRPLVAGASACVIPLRQGGGTRLKILEAMALGTPVVSTAKGAEGLDVVDGEHLLLADSPADFAEAVARLLRDLALRQRLAISARALVEQRYDWAQIGAHFVHLVEEAALSASQGAARQ
jgi:glycosyltransferase involved in cell wall biosynthesis